jgi:hypothetical protein
MPRNHVSFEKIPPQQLRPISAIKAHLTELKGKYEEANQARVKFQNENLVGLSPKITESEATATRAQALQRIAAQVTDKRNTNNSRFQGGYTGPAMIDHKIEGERITAWEKEETEKVYEKYQKNILAVKLYTEKMQQLAPLVKCENEVRALWKKVSEEYWATKKYHDDQKLRIQEDTARREAATAAHEAAVRREMERLAIQQEAQERFAEAEKRRVAAAEERAREAKERVYLNSLQVEIVEMSKLAEL